MKARGAVAAILFAVGACSPTSSASPTHGAIESPATANPASAPAIEVACTPDAQAPASLGNPCPEAALAVELAAAPVRLPIERVVIEPGPFFCDLVWPGVGTQVPCYGPAVQPGQFMHAWVRFNDSDKVAAVMLGRDLPTDIGSLLPTPPEWTATLVKVEEPPAGWTMP